MLLSDPKAKVELTNDGPSYVYLSCTWNTPVAAPGKTVELTISVLNPVPCFAYQERSAAVQSNSKYLGCVDVHFSPNRRYVLSQELQRISDAKCSALSPR